MGDPNKPLTVADVIKIVTEARNESAERRARESDSQSAYRIATKDAYEYVLHLLGQIGEGS